MSEPGGSGNVNGVLFQLLGALEWSTATLRHLPTTDDFTLVLEPMGGGGDVRIELGAQRRIIPYQDSDLEQLYTFLRHLATKLPKRSAGPIYHFDDEVRLEYYRLQKISEGSISLVEGAPKPLDGPRETGTAMLHEDNVPLSRLIDVINQHFGKDLNEADQLFFDQLVEAAVRVDELKQAAESNPIDRFQLVFKKVLQSIFIERMDMNEELFANYMNDPEFEAVVSGWLGQKVYEKLPKVMSYPTGRKQTK